MSKRNHTWRVTAGVTATLLLGSAFAVFPAPGVTPAAQAAEQKKELSREAAIQLVQQQIGIPEGYKLQDSYYEEVGVNAPIWHLNWSKDRNQFIFAGVNASTGKIQHFSRYERNALAVPEDALDPEEARKAAVRYLERLTSADERAKLSEANEYPEVSSYYLSESKYSFTFVRVENGLPFLENVIRISLNSRGELESFSRDWYEGELAAPGKTISLEEAEQKLAEGMAPSLIYSQRLHLFGLEAEDGQPTLVYQYNAEDPQFVDAVSGEVINALGKPAKPRKVVPLGTSTAASAQEKPLITREEAQQIADQLIQKFPGKYRYEGKGGSGSSSGPDGIERRFWMFTYTPVESSRDSGKPLVLSINDRGQLVGYEDRDGYGGRFGSRGNAGTRLDKAVSWEQAEKSAVELVKRLYADRLGEIYLIEKRPTEEQIRKMLEQRGYFEIGFGWLHDGIPIEYAELSVAVDPESGEAVELRMYQDVPSLKEEAGEIVGLDEAKQAETANKKLMLTYYLPSPMDDRFLPDKSAPLLVYRYVGDSGYVDARTGEWVSYRELYNRKHPQDIEGHPQQAALQMALDRGLFSAADGKLDPDRPVTRGEMARIFARLLDWSEFYRSVFLDDEEESFTFADIDQKHPLYGVIRKNLRNGILVPAAQKFEPERTVTRAEAADMAARLLGYGNLLDNAELFVPAFADLQRSQIPAVSILHAEGIFTGKSPGRFEPNGEMTRAEVAQLVQALLEYKEKANKS